MALPGVATPRVAIFIKEPDSPALVDAAAVAEAFQLTARESEITALLGSGLDLTEIFGTLAISRGTAAFHLNRIFDKTGVRSQAKLVSLLGGNRALNWSTDSSIPSPAAGEGSAHEQADTLRHAQLLLQARRGGRVLEHQPLARDRP